MTENEAIKVINDKYETFFALSTTNDFDMAMATSIKALEEIQQYRAEAIDEFVKRLKEVEQIATKCTLSQSDGYSQIMRICDEIAEQMKGK